MGMKGRKKKIGRPKVDVYQDRNEPGPREYGGGVIKKAPEVMNRREAATYLKITPVTLDGLRMAGVLEYSVPGERAVCYRRDELDWFKAMLKAKKKARRRTRSKT